MAKVSVVIKASSSKSRKGHFIMQAGKDDPLDFILLLKKKDWIKKFNEQDEDFKENHADWLEDVKTKVQDGVYTQWDDGATIPRSKIKSLKKERVKVTTISYDGGDEALSRNDNVVTVIYNGKHYMPDSMWLMLSDGVGMGGDDF